YTYHQIKKRHEGDLLTHFKSTRDDRASRGKCVTDFFKECDFFTSSSKEKKVTVGSIQQQFNKAVHIFSRPDLRSMIGKRCNTNPLLQARRQAFPNQPLAHVS